MYTDHLYMNYTKYTNHLHNPAAYLLLPNHRLFFGPSLGPRICGSGVLQVGLLSNPKPYANHGAGI